MATITKDLGVATAYGYAVAGGYTGTEEEFAELMASYASVAQEAEESAETAEAYAKGTVDGTPVGSGETGYHDNAKYYAEQASGSATNAGNSADAASGSASGASASALKSEGHAVGQQNGSDVGSGSPYYHNNAKYYKEQAGSSASAASGSAGTAADQALVSEGYAKGTQSGTPVASGTYYHDNAKYYKEQADGDASSASASATAANTDALKAEGFAVGKQNGTDVASGSPYYENNAKYYASEAANSATEAAASAASIDPDTLAKVDGYYESMTVGNAEQLVATVGVEDNAPYNFRTAGGSADIGDRMVDKIIGGTVAWNQNILNGDFSALTGWVSYNGTLTIANNVATYEVTALSDNPALKQTPKIYVAGHRVLILADIYPAHTKNVSIWIVDYQTNTSFSREVTANKWNTVSGILTLTAQDRKLQEFQINLRCTANNGYSVGDQDKLRNVMLIDLTQMFGSTIAEYIYSLETANAGAGVAWFRKLFPKPYYAYDTGSLQSVQAKSHDTVGFNQWDEEWEVGSLDSKGDPLVTTNTIRSKNYIPVVGGQAYYYTIGNTWMQVCLYDADKNFILDFGTDAASNNPKTLPSNAAYMKFRSSVAYGNTYNHDICINLSWDGERDGEYEAYVKHSYPLDDSLTLRGIPKLNASNELYYDGDEYESDGTVTRRYGIVDLGTATWSSATQGGHVMFYATLPGGKQISFFNGLCSKYPTDNDASYTKDKCGRCYGSTDYGGFSRIGIRDDSYENAETFKTAMSGVKLVYELATPTEETADPFQTPQIVNDFGTEEFVDARTIPIPVGHNSKYQANLRAKLEMAPNSPSGDGDYIVRQASGQNTYVPITFPADELPAAPTTDGNYVLKCTVSSGTATFEWEAQT